MKKIITLTIALLLAGFITGCGGGGGGGGSAATTKPSSSQSAGNEASGATNVSQAKPTLTNTQVELTDADKALNITYKSVATGDFPPSPPASNAPDASSAIN